MSEGLSDQSHAEHYERLVHVFTDIRHLSQQLIGLQGIVGKEREKGGAFQ